MLRVARALVVQFSALASAPLALFFLAECREGWSIFLQHLRRHVLLEHVDTDLPQLLLLLLIPVDTHRKRVKFPQYNTIGYCMCIIILNRNKINNQ